MIPTIQLAQFGRDGVDRFTHGLLDRFSGAIAAYSVARKLRGNAPKYSLRAYNAAETVFEDLQWLENGRQDTAALLRFAAGSTAKLGSLYDQSGNGFDLAGGVRPVLVTGGTLETLGMNNQPAAKFNSSFLDTSITAPSFGTSAGLGGNAAFSIFAVHKKTTNTGGCVMGWGDTAVALEASGLYDDGSNGLYAFAGGNSYVCSVPTNNTYYLTSVIKTAGAINTTTQVYRNGSSVGTSGHATTTPNIDGGQVLAWGQWATFTSNRFIGSMQELIIFAGDKSSDRNAIEADINAFYGIY
jgi:hypothetical protein